MSRWSLMGWMIVYIAAVYHLAYALLLLPFGVYRVPSLYPVISGLYWLELSLGVVLTVIGIGILIAKLITGLRERDAGRVLGVAIGWALLLGIPTLFHLVSGTVDAPRSRRNRPHGGTQSSLEPN